MNLRIIGHVDLDTDAISLKDGYMCSPNGALFFTTSRTPKTGRRPVEI